MLLSSKNLLSITAQHLALVAEAQAERECLLSQRATTTDLGMVVGTAWNGVTIDWDDGHTASIQRNDMAQVERVPVKV
jgi:hypothetical protein